MRLTHIALLPLALLAPATALAQAPLGVGALRVEYLTNPVGIDVVRPRLSWVITSTERNSVQTAYQVQYGLKERGRRWPACGGIPSTTPSLRRASHPAPISSRGCRS